MKTVNAFVLVASVLTQVSCFASKVSIDDASAAARECSSEFGYGDAVTEVVPWIVSGDTVGYLAQGDGRVYVMSADTGMSPLVAVVSGNIRDFMNEESFSIFGNDVAEATRVVENARPTLLSSAGSERSVSGLVSENNGKWARILRSAAGSVNVPMASSSVSSSEEDYVIPGFEDGGRFTHWGQHVARELSDVHTTTYGLCAWPLYNYYMYWYNSWGSSNGLGIVTHPIYSSNTNSPASFGWIFGDVQGDHPNRVYGPSLGDYAGNSVKIFASTVRPRKRYPCGCVATAYSAMFQCLGVTGSVAAVGIGYYVLAPNSPVVNPYVWNNDFRMTIDYDNTQGTYLAPDDPVGEEDIDHFRFLNPIPGKLDWESLPWTYGGFGKTNLYYGIEGFHSDIFSVGYHDGGMKGLDDDGKVMTKGARDLCGRLTYNLGIMLNMMYKAGVATANTTNFVHTLRSSRVFPGLGKYGFISSSWDGEVAGKIIRAGNPVAVSLFDEDNGGHCVLAVGRKKALGKDYTRLFMGWNGSSDSWYLLDEIVYITTGGYTFTSVRSMSAIGGYDGAAVPVHGKVIDSNGDPVGGVDVCVTNVRDALVTNLKTGSDGYFRGWVKAASLGQSASAGDTFTYTISCGSDSRSYTANSYMLGDGTIRNGRYDNLQTWSSQFPTQNITFTVSPGKRNRYVFGTPYGFDYAVKSAIERVMPVVIVCGVSGSESAADEYVRSIDEPIRSNVVFYFVDKTDSSFSYVDDGMSLMMVDPRRFVRGGPWNSENGVIRHGSFSNAYDFENLVKSAWNVFDRKYRWSDHL